jgi:pyruvate/2-oxoglutarate dehydrogenase complex dihydrolipoamide acyltransferase (E2) component
MPLFEFKLPDIGEGVAEGEVVAWHVAAGDEVREDQEMVEVMTDKATVSIGAPHTGRIAELCVGVGERVPVGSVLVVIDTSSGSQPKKSPSKPTGVTASAVGDLRESRRGPASSKHTPGIRARRRLARATLRA